MTDQERASLKNALCWAVLVIWIAIVIWRKIEVRRHIVEDAVDKAANSVTTLRSAKKNLAALSANAKVLRHTALLGRQLLEKRQNHGDTLACLNEMAKLAKAEGVRYHSVNLSAAAREDPLAGPLLHLNLDGPYGKVRRFLWRLETSPTMAARIMALKLKSKKGQERAGGKPPFHMVFGTLTMNLRTGWKAGLDTLKEVTAHGKP